MKERYPNLLWSSERGSAMLEVSLLCALIAFIVLASLTQLGTDSGTAICDVGAAIESANISGMGMVSRPC